MKTESFNILVFAFGDLASKLVMSNNFKIIIYKTRIVKFDIQYTIHYSDLTSCYG